MTDTGGFQQQCGVFPLTVFLPDLSFDLRFCLLDAVVRLRQSVGFFPYLIVATPPIERLPSQRKASDAYVGRKNLYVLNPHVTDGDAEVRDVLSFGDAAVVVRLLFLQVSLADFRAIL